MTILFLLIPLSILMACIFLYAFVWAVRSGQYEDTCTPAMRLLLDDQVVSDLPAACRGDGKVIKPKIAVPEARKGDAAANSDDTLASNVWSR